jgi:hypothetical protein
MMAIGIHLDDDESPDSRGSIFARTRKGSWWISSKTDPRWDCSGTAMVGGFLKPAGVDVAVASKQKTLGEPPTDLEWGYMKD